MAGSVNSKIGSEVKSEALIATSELKKRDYTLKMRLEELTNEQGVLEEIRDSLLEEEQILKKRLKLLKENQKEIDFSEDSATKNNFSVLEEVENFKREIAVFERRCEENRLRDVELKKQIAEANKALEVQMKQFATATGELENGRETLARMDRKISITSTKPR